MGAYLALLKARERELADGLLALAARHADDPDVGPTAQLLAGWSQAHVEALDALGAAWPQREAAEPVPPLLTAREAAIGSYGLLLDLESIWPLAQDVHLRWTILGQAARVLRDAQLEAACAALGAQTARQVAWLHTCLVEAAPQALIAAL